MKIIAAILICSVAVSVRAAIIDHVNSEINDTMVAMLGEVDSTKPKQSVHIGGDCQGGINAQVSGGIDIVVAGQTSGNPQIPIRTGVSTAQVGGSLQIVGGSSSVGTGVAIVHPVKPNNHRWILTGQQGQSVGAQQGITVSGGHYAIPGRKHNHHHARRGHRGNHGAGVQVVGGGQVVDVGYTGLSAHKRARLERKMAKRIAKLQAASYVRPQSCCQTVPCDPCSG